MQHNCFDAGCTLTKTKARKVEKQLTDNFDLEITHQNLNSYILNASAHYSAHIHRDLSNRGIPPVSPQEWVQAIEDGLAKWKAKGAAAAAACPVSRAAG